MGWSAKPGILSPQRNRYAASAARQGEIHMAKILRRILMGILTLALVCGALLYLRVYTPSAPTRNLDREASLASERLARESRPRPAKPQRNTAGLRAPRPRAESAKTLLSPDFKELGPSSGVSEADRERALEYCRAMGTAPYLRISQSQDAIGAANSFSENATSGTKGGLAAPAQHPDRASQGNDVLLSYERLRFDRSLDAQPATQALHAALDLFEAAFLNSDAPESNPFTDFESHGQASQFHGAAWLCVLRAVSRGQEQRASELLARILALTRRANMGWQKSVMSPLMSQLAAAGEFDCLARSLLAQTQRFFDAMVPTKEQLRDMRTVNLPWIRKRLLVPDLHRKENTLSWVSAGLAQRAMEIAVEPAWRRAVDEAMSAWIDGDPATIIAAEAKLRRIQPLRNHIGVGFDCYLGARPFPNTVDGTNEDTSLSVESVLDVVEDAALKGEIDYARFVCAAQLYRKDHGRYPNGGADLVPAYLDSSFSGSTATRWFIVNVAPRQKPKTSTTQSAKGVNPATPGGVAYCRHSPRTFAMETRISSVVEPTRRLLPLLGKLKKAEKKASVPKEGASADKQRQNT